MKKGVVTHRHAAVRGLYRTSPIDCRAARQLNTPTQDDGVKSKRCGLSARTLAADALIASTICCTNTRRCAVRSRPCSRRGGKTPEPVCAR